MRFLHFAFAALAVIAVTQTASAHQGRRFDVQVIDNQLFAQGYLSPGFAPDGGGNPRPYFNAIHGHWSNLTTNVAQATLPSFDVLTAGPLESYNLTLELLGSSKWENPPMDLTGVVPNLVPLSPSEKIAASRDTFEIDTDSLGTLPLTLSPIPGSGAPELDMGYVIEDNPSNALYVLEWKLTTDAPGIADSGSVYTILSPDGGNPMEKLHHAALHLEKHLGLHPVPEPGSVLLSAIFLVTTAIGFALKRKS